jgi:DNA polymerase-3 subunit beta
MKFTCERSIILKEAAIAQEIISSKILISVLSNIYLQVENDTLFIRSTDTVVSFQTKLPVNVIESGSTTVFGEKFLGILNTIPDGLIEFEQKDNKFIITYKPEENQEGKGSKKKKDIKFELKTVASESFPEFPVDETISFFEIPARDFKEMITHTIFAVSDDETRYYMNGVFFENVHKAQDDNGEDKESGAENKETANLNDSGKIVMVATDGRRLAYINKDVGSITSDFKGAIIPTKILTIVTKHLGEEGNISIGVSEKTIYINFGIYNLVSMLLEGQFPNYRRVIPASHTRFFKVNRKDLLDAIKRVAQLVEKKSNRIYLSVAKGDDDQSELTLFSEEGEIGYAEEKMACVYDGEDAKIPISYIYLEEPLKAITQDEINVSFTETNHAITVKPEPSEDYFHIIMPMQGD